MADQPTRCVTKIAWGKEMNKGGPYGGPSYVLKPKGIKTVTWLKDC